MLRGFMQKAVTEVEVRGDAVEDPGTVDGVTSTPAFRTSHQKKNNA